VTANGRFAPSPTGTLHLGNLRTALLAWLFARSTGSRFALRIEDLDPGRSREQFVAEQLGDLAALGLDWDEPVMRQSERDGAYADALAALEADGLVYPCYCTRAEIREATSAPHMATMRGRYPGTCRHLTAAQRAAFEAEGRPPALRARAGGARVAVRDRLLGDIGGPVEEMVLRRNDGAYAYNLAVVVDDAAQGVEEVVRGADLTDATPGQVWLQRRLGLPTPAYAHVPLMFGDDGERLAKRHGAVTLAQVREAGRTAGQVRATLASSVGLPLPADDVTMTDLLAAFDPDVLRP
jgi:glutamyl-tRNA synthetase